MEQHQINLILADHAIHTAASDVDNLPDVVSRALSRIGEWRHIKLQLNNEKLTTL